MSLTIYEGFPSRKLTTGEKPTAEFAYVILGTTDEQTARALLSTATPTVYQNLLRESLHVEEVAPAVWEGSVKYGTKKEPEAGDWKWDFDTTGGSQKITQSKTNVGNYARAGENAPNFGGAIGVTDDSVEGCEIVVPEFKWNETHQLDADVVTWTYSQKLYQLTGKTNKAAFRGFSANQVLFLGAKGSQSAKNPDLVEMTFSFKAGAHAANLSIDGITVSSKKAWEYLWLRYGPTLDGYAKKLIKRATSAHVERVYDEGDFGDLGIGN